ncbi:MAG: hypothetical protein ORN53_02710 [Crocinitomicaceae bacterium]|nr:hypothetical protein [Crocinitomicaceae bacterium]
MLVFISQLFLVTFVSFTMDSNIVSFDTELTSDGDFSDELDSSDEGDFSLLLEEELEKEYFLNSEMNPFFPMEKEGFFTYIHSQSLLFPFKYNQPPEDVL